MKKILIIISILPTLVFAHGGGLDKNGGHSGPDGYHCHREPCISQFKESDEALSEAIEEDRPFSYVYNRNDSKHWSDFDNDCMNTRTSDLDVDHIVPLKWANDHGGDKWSAEMKEKFANDPINLLAVDDALNQSKGAQGPNEWMPPNKKFHCEYLKMWSNILEKYIELKMLADEKRFFKAEAAACL